MQRSTRPRTTIGGRANQKFNCPFVYISVCLSVTLHTLTPESHSTRLQTDLRHDESDVTNDAKSENQHAEASNTSEVPQTSETKPRSETRSACDHLKHLQSTRAQESTCIHKQYTYWEAPVPRLSRMTESLVLLDPWSGGDRENHHKTDANQAGTREPYMCIHV